MARRIVCVLDRTVGHVSFCWDYVSIFIYKNSNYNKINQIWLIIKSLDNIDSTVYFTNSDICVSSILNLHFFYISQHMNSTREYGEHGSFLSLLRDLLTEEPEHKLPTSKVGS